MNSMMKSLWQDRYALSVMYTKLFSQPVIHFSVVLVKKLINLLHFHLFQVVIGGRNKYLINGSNANNTRVQDMFRSVQLNVNNPHFLIMQGRITKVLNMKPPEVSVHINKMVMIVNNVLLCFEKVLNVE